MGTHLDSHIRVRVGDNKALSIETVSENRNIRLLGSTMQTSSPSEEGRDFGYRSLQSFVAYPDYGQEGIIAITIHAMYRCGKKGNDIDHEDTSVFLHVTWKEGEDGLYPWIDLKNPWISATRVGQVTKKAIQVLTKGQRYCSFDHASLSSSSNESFPLYVPDGDLLCRYLWGTASEDEVIAATQKVKSEASAVEQLEEMALEIENLKRQIIDLEADRQYEITLKKQWIDECRKLVEAVERLPFWRKTKHVGDLSHYLGVRLGIKA